MEGRKVAIGCTIGCVAVGLIAALVVVGFVFLVSSVGPPEDIQMRILAPNEVTVGETFDLVIKLRNERTSRSFQLMDIDIYDGYLDGFQVQDIQPAPREKMENPLLGCVTHTYNSTIPAGEVRSVTFTLKAVQTGIYRGDIDVSESLTKMITWTTSTVVNPKE